MVPTRTFPAGSASPRREGAVMYRPSWSFRHPGSFFARHHRGGSCRQPEGFGPGFGWGGYSMGHGGHGPQEEGFEGGPGGFAGFGGGPFGVRRPLRFLAYKLGLDEKQVAELARVLDELK